MSVYADDPIYGGRVTMYIGSRRDFTFTAAEGQDPNIAGQTHEFRLIDTLGLADTITIPEASLVKNTSTGVITAPVLEGETEGRETSLYRGELWRTDTPHGDKIGWLEVDLVP